MLARLTILTTLILSLAVLRPSEASVIPRATCSNGISVNNSICCQLFPVMDSIQSIFKGITCSEFGHQMLHLAYHDAMGFSRLGGKGGGADGSILTFSGIEGAYPTNIGLEQTIAILQFVRSKHNISDGDLVHFAAAVGISTCPGAPQLQFLFGRPPAKMPAPDGTVPSPSDGVTAILQRFGDVGFSPAQMVSLLSAHSLAANYKTDPGASGQPLDSTPEIFDTQIFIETLLVGRAFPGNGSNPGEVKSPMVGEVRLQSDFEIARDSRTACLWQGLTNDQKAMQSQFKAAMLELQLVGQNRSSMVDCTEVIPIPPALPVEAKPHFPAGFGTDDIEKACAAAVFPSLPTDPGPVTSIPPVMCYGSAPNCWREDIPAPNTSSVLGTTSKASPTVTTSSANLSSNPTTTTSTAKSTSG